LEFMASYKPTGPQGRSNGASARTLKAGEYPAQIIQVKLKVSRCGQFDQQALRVRVEDAANDHWEDFWETLTFSDLAMWKVEQVLASVGMDASEECEIAPEHWLEKRCRVSLEERDGRLQIKRWLKRKAAPAGKRPPDALSRLKATPVAVGGDGLPF